MGRHKRGEDVNGWLIVDKPRGTGSTDVVNFTRRFFNARKNGHCGTLDPFATGVLPVAFGEATKLILAQPALFTDYEITKGNMDDVFLAATGKKLHGGAEV